MPAAPRRRDPRTASDQVPLAMRRLTRAMVLASLCVVAATAIAWVGQRPRFSFHRIVVTGELRHVNRADVRAALAGRLRGNFFTMHLAATRRAIETVPWVQSASVRRVWPDSLWIRIEERRALGVWDDGRLLSDQGVLFEGNEAEAEVDGANLQFSGPPSMATEINAALSQLNTSLNAMQLHLAGIDLSERGSWTVKSDDGREFILGRDDPPGSVGQRLAGIARAYPRVVAQLGAAPRRFDARYDNGFAVTRP